MIKKPLCCVCGAFATFVEIRPYVGAVIRRDASVEHIPAHLSHYYCDLHTGVPA